MTQKGNIRKVLKKGSRMTYYIKKKDFPEEMLDWLNGQSDLNLLFDYALDRLFQEVGRKDIAALLPRNYEIGQGIKGNLSTVVDLPKRQVVEEKVIEKEMESAYQEVTTTLSSIPVDEEEVLEPIEIQRESLVEDISEVNNTKAPEETEEKLPVKNEALEIHVDPVDKEESIETNQDEPSNKSKGWNRLNELDDQSYY